MSEENLDRLVFKATYTIGVIGGIMVGWSLHAMFG